MAFPPGPYENKYNELQNSGVTVLALPMRTNFVKSVLLLRRLVIAEHITHIHAHKLRADVLAVCASLFLKNVQIVTTIHVVPKYDIRSGIKRALYFLPGFLCYRFFIQKVFTVSTEVKKITENYYLLPKHKVITTLNSISFSEITTDKHNQKKIIKDFNIPVNQTVIVCAGELSRRKGQEFILKALSFLEHKKEVTLILLGNGYLKDELIELAQRLNITRNVVFAGHRYDIYDWMSIGTIYIQPSVFDPLPRAMLEAMYMRLPVIASDLDTMKDVVFHKKTGLLTPLRPEKIAENIRLLIEDKQLAETIADNGHNFIKKNCSIETMVGTMLQNMFTNESV